MIPYGRQNLSKEDIEAVCTVLQSDFITQGPAIEKFEQAVAAYCGTKYAVAVCNGTAALHLACMAAGLSSQDILWTSPITFVASANCGRYCDATVDFVDIDAKTYNLSVDKLEQKLEEAQKTGRLPKVVIPVHLTGQSCEIDKIAALSKKYHFQIIEDASHAIGGTYKDQKVGSCQFSDMTVFSFHPVKIITTGEGGMILTNNKTYFQKLQQLRTHGITRNPDQMTHQPDGPWYYQQIDLGYNYRITDFQAALGYSQLQRLDQFVKRRQELAQRYDKAFANLPIVCPYQHPDTYSAFHLYVIRLQLDQLPFSHREIFEKLRNAGIGVNLHYIPVHTQPYYKSLNADYGPLPEAEKYYQEAISLPIYYTLTDKEQDKVIDTLTAIIKTTS